MTTPVVIDSGILLADFLPDEPLSTQSKNLLAELQRNSMLLVAPMLFLYEVMAVLRKAVYQQRLTGDQANALVDKALAYPIQYHFSSDLLRDAFTIATQYNRPRAYDSQYIALAQQLDCDFWTTDERLFNSVQGQLTRVRWLGDFDDQ